MIKCVTDASAFISAAIGSHSDAWKRAMNTEEYVMEMKRPFVDDELKKAGIAWSNNYNYGKGRADVEQAVSSNAKEIFIAISLLELDFHRFDPEKYKKKDSIFAFLQYSEMKSDFAERIANCFAEILEQDSAIDIFLSQTEYNSFMWGYCPVTRDKFSYLGNPVHYTDIAFESRTAFDSIKKFAVFDVVKGTTLMDILVEDCKTISGKWHKTDETLCSNGWIKSQLVELCCSIFSENDEAREFLREKKFNGNKELTIRYESWEDIQSLVENKGQIWAGVNLNDVHVGKTYEFENGGYWETYSVMSSPASSQGDVNLVSASIKYVIFQKFHPNQTQEDLISLIKEFSINGSEYIHEMKGAGRFIAEESQRYDFKRNAIEDKLLLTGNINVIMKDGLAGEKLKLRVIGGVTEWPEGAEMVPNQIRYDLQDHVQSIAMDDQAYHQRIQHYKPSLDLSSRPTKDEVQTLNAQFQDSRTKNIPFKLKDYSVVIFNAFKALVNNTFKEDRIKAKKELFFEKLIEEFSEFKLDKEDIVKILGCVENIRINPVIKDREAIQQAIQYAASGGAKRRLIKMFLMSFGFSRSQIKTFLDQEDYGDEAQVASFENNVFFNSSEVVFGSNQDHIIHLTAHFYKIDAMFKMLAQGDDPMRIFNYVVNALNNTKMHVLAIESNYFFKSRFKEFLKVQDYFEKKTKELAGLLDQAKKQAAQQATEGQQGEGDIPPELKHQFYLDRVKTLDKIERANMRDKDNQQRQEARFEFQSEMAMKKAELDADLKKKKVETDIELNQARKAADMVTP